MFVFSLLLALVGAEDSLACGLPFDVDPGITDGDKVTYGCKIDDIWDEDAKEMIGSGWAAFDADVYIGETWPTVDGTTGEPIGDRISLEIVEKGEHMDAFKDNHSGTVSTISAKANGRYILPCKQEADEKTVSFVVHRPAKYTAFGAEWVKLFPKDSWENVTNEYEPFTFNKYGAKVPLLRAHNDDGNEDALKDGPTSVEFDNVTVYMEVKEIGDYEVMYGNPAFTTEVWDRTGDTEPTVVEKGWVAIQFKKTLLRVGSPWAECSDKPVAGETLPTETYEIGTIVPAFFGHPNLNLERYKALAQDLKDADVKVKVVLEIFNSETKTYTRSETGVDASVKTEHPKAGVDYTKCYVAGNACPEDHSVCKSKFCELDTWEAIIKLFKAGGAEVLGAVGADTTSSQYGELENGVDGFFFMAEGTVESPKLANSVYALGEPLLKTEDINAVDTFVTLSDSKVGIWNPYSWYPRIDNTKWAAIMDEVDSADMQKRVDTLFDRGYGYVFLTDEIGFNTSSSYNKALLKAIGEKAGFTERRLQARELSTVTYEWSCDDTGFQCSPVCLAQDGPVTSIASNTKCTDAPLDPCECKCYYDAAWVCSSGEVVCQATKGIETMIVGDLLCENRGTPKPSFEALSDQRQAGECARKPTTRGQFPLPQCVVQWATTTTDKPEAEVEVDESTTIAPTKQQAEELTLEVGASFAAAASMFVALSQ